MRFNPSPISSRPIFQSLQPRTLVRLAFSFHAFVIALSAISGHAESPVADQPETNYETIASGPVRVSLDPKMGGRIASFTFAGKEVLRTQRDENHWHWGSTVWTSPQSDWGWPPIATFDQMPFSVVRSDGEQVELASDVDPKTQLQMTKNMRFEPSPDDGLPILIATYTLTNRGNENRAVAIWENTRVRWSGVVSIPVGGTYRLSNQQAPIETRSQDGQMRITLDDSQPDAQKIFYTPASDQPLTKVTYRVDGLTLTKTHTTPERVAPDQSPLEIYLAPKDGFAELEIQSQYHDLAADDSASMRVQWSLRP